MNYVPPTIQPPTRDELRDVAARHYMELREDELAVFEEFIEAQLEVYERLDELPAPGRETPYTDRVRGYRPPADENPHNAIATVCEVAGDDDGPLAGYDVGVKDSIAVAGVELTCGSKLLEGYVPDRDATVVERVLDAGGTVTAKTNMEDLAWSGSGELSALGPVLNPHDPAYLAGGSSGGSAAAVADGSVDVALGTDQGGSVRMPASWCGVVGLKPTHGLVPYTGTVPLDPTIDHLGPLAGDVTDCARVLDVVAGPDGEDPRQRDVRTAEYETAVGNAPDPDDLTIGVLEEGFDREESESAVDETVEAAVDDLEDAGATVDRYSVPWHRDGEALLTAIATEGTAALARNDGVTHFTSGGEDHRLARTFGRARRANADDYPPMMKLAVLFGQYMADAYQSQYYAKARALVPELRAAYDDVLAEVDVLALPTTPEAAHEAKTDASLAEVMERALSMNGNTSPFNGSGHPAVSVPCGTADGRPVGLMLVGTHFDDDEVLRAARTVERTLDWETR